MEARPTPDWLRRARAAADAPPALPRVPLLFGADAAPVGSIEPRLGERLAAAGLPLRQAGAAWWIAEPGDEALAAIARWLHAERVCSRWRDELLAVCDATGRPLGAIERAAVRTLGIATEAVHLDATAVPGGTWVQLRAHGKATDPGQWDTTMGGQVGHRESIEETLRRETLEEAGLDLASLDVLRRRDDVVIRRPVAEGYMVERIVVFGASLAADLQPLNHDGEVERFERLDDAALAERLAAGRFTLEATLILGARLEQGTCAAR